MQYIAEYRQILQDKVDLEDLHIQLDLGCLPSFGRITNRISKHLALNKQFLHMYVPSVVHLNLSMPP